MVLFSVGSHSLVVFVSVDSLGVFCKQVGLAHGGAHYKKCTGSNAGWMKMDVFVVVG